MSALQVNKRRKVKWKNIFQLFVNVRTPDLRHQEQMSLVLRYVVNTKKEMVTVNVIGFKLVHDQNGRG
jgi:hypothetical protein